MNLEPSSADGQGVGGRVEVKQPEKREEPVRISPAGCIMKKSLISNINLQDIVYGLNMSIL